MEAQSLEINGYELLMKLMDSSYIMCEDETSQGVTVDVGCRHLSPCWPNPLFSLYYRKLYEAYAVGPVIVWHHKRIVGFLPMSVNGCGLPQMPLCVHYTGGIAYGAEYHIDLPMIQGAIPYPFDKLTHKEIGIGCMSVHHAMRGQNLARLMIQYIINWGRQNGWDRVVARAMMDGEPYSFYPTSSFWIGAGFKPIGPVHRFGPSGDAIDQSRAIDLAFDLND